MATSESISTGEGITYTLKSTELERSNLRPLTRTRSFGRKRTMEIERPWASLMGDLMADVFRRLPFEELLKTVPLVCKAWRTACHSSACWKDVDMRPWIKNKCELNYGWEFDCKEEMEDALKLVVDRSHGQLRSLRTMFCSNESLEYIAKNCPLLVELSITESFYVEDESALLLAENCRLLKSLDLSDCYRLTARSLEMFGRNCCGLIRFSRNMLRSHEFDGLDLPDGDQEAVAISSHMRGLKHLELKRSLSLTDSGLMHIASGCRELESLDLACCSSVSPRGLEKVSALCLKLKSFVKPINPRISVSTKLNGWMLWD
ncbi:hypothetical protein R1sor_019600 [Riccia sorocarpa]|uniref:F-box domain-containing protein n=1 Tax=Riccia sorocarpa TaxID=122646 RepID=A0ABD3ICZ0_9MARC